MVSKKEETASFVLRFTQKVYQSEEGEHEVQWRGNIRHVQGGEEKRFSDFDAVTQFIQNKLTDLTLQAMENKTPEEQKGILSKSLDLWKKVTSDAPKIVMDTIKDPMKQVAQIQHQVQEIGDNIGQKINDRIGQAIEIDEWRGASRSDFKQLVDVVEQLSQSVASLNEKVDRLSSKKKA